MNNLRCRSSIKRVPFFEKKTGFGAGLIHAWQASGIRIRLQDQEQQCKGQPFIPVPVAPSVSAAGIAALHAAAKALSPTEKLTLFSAYLITHNSTPRITCPGTCYS